MRYSAFFDNGVVIYSNAFARFDSSTAATPYRESPHSINYFLTVLFNLALLGIIFGSVLLLRRLFAHKKLKS